MFFYFLQAVAYMEDVIMPTICSSDDVLIQVKSGSVDPIDIKICSGYARVLRKQLNKYNLVSLAVKLMTIAIY